MNPDLVTYLLNDPLGVHVIYDGVGKDTFMGNLDCLMRRGSLVQYGNASGRVSFIIREN